MSGKHTPRPWAVVQGDDEDDVTVCAFDGNPANGIMSDVVCEVSSINELSDAHLICAAPDMLEALKAVRESSEWSCMEAETQDAVNAALAKAEAKASPSPVKTSMEGEG